MHFRTPMNRAAKFALTCFLLAALMLAPLGATAEPQAGEAPRTAYQAVPAPQISLANPAQSDRPHPAESGAAPVGVAQPATEEPLDYASAVRQVVTASPELKATQLDVEVSKLGEKDSWYRLFPKLNMAASYDTPLSNYESGAKAQSYVNVNFSTGSYDPVAAYIGHDASKVAIKLAEMTHLLAIQTIMEKIGLSYISLNSQEKLVACRQEIHELNRQLVSFASQRADKGSVSPLDMRLVELRAAVSQKELEHTNNLRMQEIIRLKRMLGMQEERKVSLNTERSLQQIAGEQSVYAIPNFSQVERNNLEFKIMKLREKLQSYNIRLAQADHLPKFNIGLRTPDPTATKDNSAPYYLTFSASVPLWYWGETVRSVERAELNARRLSTTNTQQMNIVRDNWTVVGMDLGLLREQLAIAATTRELRELEAKRASISNQNGNTPYQVMIETRIAAVHAKMAEIKAQEDYAVARLKIRVQSGELFNEHIRVGHAAVE